MLNINYWPPKIGHSSSIIFFIRTEFLEVLIRDNFINHHDIVDFTAHVLTAIVVIIGTRTSHHEASDQQSHAQSEEDVQNSHR
jgi:hypothetical protein